MRTHRLMYLSALLVLASFGAPSAAAASSPPTPAETLSLPFPDAIPQLAVGSLQVSLSRLGVNLYQENTMAESIREGGVYRVGDKWLTADGKETKAPSRAELQKSGERRTASTTVSAEPIPPEFNEDFPSYKVLTGAGLDSLDAVRSATDEQLLALDGIGDASLKKIREAQGE